MRDPTLLVVNIGRQKVTQQLLGDFLTFNIGQRVDLTLCRVFNFCHPVLL